MAGAASMIALDTNLLVYAHRSETREHRPALAVLERARRAAGWGMAFPVWAEFWQVVTNAANPQPSAPEVAAGFWRQLQEAGARIWLPPPGLPATALEAAVKGRVRGARIYDLQIALIARANGAEELWTHDAGFVRVPGLRVRDPLEG